MSGMERQQLGAAEVSETHVALANFAAERRDMVAAFDTYVDQNRMPDGAIGKLTVLQSATLLKVRDFAAGNTTHGMLQLPCGYGKSPLAITVADALGIGLPRADGSNRQALLNTSRNSIVGQFVNRNIQYGNDDQELLGDFAFFAPRIVPTVFNKFGKDTSGDVIVMPYQSLGNVIRSGAIKPEQFSLYLLDESHNMGRGRAEILGQFASHGLFIGLSATPEKSRRFLPNLIDQISMSEGIIKHGFLSDIKLYGLETDCSFNPQGHAAGDYRLEDIEHLAASETRNRLIIDTIYDNVTRHGPGLVKCHRQLHNGFNHLNVVTQLANENAPLITRDGKTRKLRVEAVSSKIKGSAALIEEFIHSNSIDALTFVDLVGEGFNMPHSSWGLWTPPTESYRALEQFIGRGIRRDANNPDKVFHFSQLVDNSTLGADNALGWELFDVPRDAAETRVTKKYGVQHRLESDKTPTPGGTTDTEQMVTYTSNTSRLAMLSLDISMRERDPGKEVITLDDIEEMTKVDRSWLKRVFYDEGFTAYMRLVNGDPAITYNRAVLDFVAQEMATSEDLSIIEAAEKLDMNVANTRKWLDRFDIEITSLYPRTWVTARRQGHLKPAQFERFIDLLSKEATPLQPHEMKLISVTTELKLSRWPARTENFIARGFTLVQRKIAVGAKNPQQIGLKEELLPWMDAYRNARPVPQTGYVWIGTLPHCKFPEGKAEYSDIFIALQRLGIKPRIFVRKGRDYTDYIPTKYQEALTEEVRTVISQRVAAEADPSLEPPKINGCIYGIDPRRSRETFPVPTKNVSIQEMKLRVQTASQAKRDQSKPVKEVVVPGYIDHLVNVQRAVMARHPAFKAMDKKSPDYPKQVRHMIENILGRASTPLPQIPRNWVYSGDLATELNISEITLVRLLVDKQINDQHVRYIDLNGIRGILAFCSPELAATLRKNK